MAKRAAANYLTDQNWDKEEEVEEGGEFQSASSDVISQRTIIKAKRRCNPSGTQSSAESTLFKGFAGFSKPAGGAAASTVSSSESPAKEVKNTSFPLPLPSNETAAKKFGRSEELSELNRSLLSWLNDHVSKDSACDLTPVVTSYSSQVASISSAVDNGATSSSNAGKSPESKKPDSTKGGDALTANAVPLSELFKKAGDTWECTVCFVMNKNVDAKCLACTSARPAGIVTAATATSPAKSPNVSRASVTAESSGQPSLAELFKKSADEWECKSCWVRNKSSTSECVACNAKNPAGASQATTKSEAEISSVSSSTTTAATSFSFAPQGGFTFKLPEGGSLFSFGSGGTSSSSSFSFKSATSTTTDPPKGSTGFTFGTPVSTLGQGFSLKPPEASSSDNKEEEGEGEEYVPPKAETVAHVESDAFCTVRCKLFYQKNGQWNERGLGNLFLKPCGERTQLLIRADTSLGNILLNVMLTDNMPISRQGANNVSLACVPNPPIEASKASKQPVCMLIRVKNGEMADELFTKMNESKSKSSSAE